MTTVSLELFRKGHLPVMGEWFALPLIEEAGSAQIGDAFLMKYFIPLPFGSSTIVMPFFELVAHRLELMK